MKKIFLVLLIIPLLLLSACKKDYTFTGTITNINNNTAIIAVDENEDITGSGDLVSISLDKSTEELSINDKIIVTYTGEVMESYPLQVNVINIEKIK